MNHLFRRMAGLLCVVVLAVLVSACATTDYTTHYGIFTAENSAGEVRQFRVHWQTVRYEGWTEDKRRALPVVLQTQCSDRKLYFYDASFGAGRRCEGAEAQGIYYCGDGDQDVDRRGLAIEDDMLCGSITDRQGARDILSLEGEVLLTLQCRPKQTEVITEDEKRNVDYLLNSSIPYVISTKKIKGKPLDELIPTISNHSSICDPDA